MKSDPLDPNVLLDYVEGELSSAARSEVERQLAADPALRELVQAMQSDREALRSLPRLDPPVHTRGDAEHALERDLLLGPPEPIAATLPGRDAITTPARPRTPCSSGSVPCPPWPQRF